MKKHLVTLSILIASALCQGITVGEINLPVTAVETKVATKSVQIEELPEEVEEIVQDECQNVKEVMLEVSYYCACEKCCDVETGITASGAKVQSGVTVAMPSSVPFGTKVYIEELDHVFTVQDRGGYIKQLDDNTMRVDVYVDSHELALELGRHMSKGILYY